LYTRALSPAISQIGIRTQANTPALPLWQGWHSFAKPFSRTDPTTRSLLTGFYQDPWRRRSAGERVGLVAGGGYAAAVGQWRLAGGAERPGERVRVRYEISRQLAPYADVEWTRSFDNTADCAPEQSGVRS